MSLYHVLGQENIAELLERKIKNNRVSHAYIFQGAKGVGKYKMAIEYAKALNCSSDSGDACDTCQNCRRIEHNNYQDVVLVRPEGSSIKIEQIRQLQKDAHFKVVGSAYKVFIINQAELMTIQAANSLLKFLEEPSSHAVVILLVENKHQLLSTIRSRCQTINLAPLGSKNMVKILSNEYKESDILIASSLTENIDEVKDILISEKFAKMRNLVIQWSEDIILEKYQALLAINETIIRDEYLKEHLPHFLDLLMVWFKDMLNIKLKRESFIIYKEYLDVLNKQANHITEEKILNAIESILSVKQKIASYMNVQLALEHMVLTLWEG